MSVQLEFLGAAGGVTGSRTLIKWEGKTFLIDCGLFQGPKDARQRNREPMLAAGTKVDAIILTHAHLDHSGYLPRFYREGYRGPIYCSDGTADLLPVLLKDSAYLEEEFARFANKTGYSSHRPAEPLFTQDDVEKVVKLIKPLERNIWIQLADNFSVRFVPAGHIIGASMVQCSFAQENGTRILTFSGDLGHNRSLTMRGPEALVETDVLVLESTYGDRLHPRTDTVALFAEIAQRTFARQGTLVIPAFAVGRAQEILYLIRICEDRGLIPKVPVTLDSPMSNEATRIFFDHPEDHKENLQFTGENASEDYLPELFGTTTTADDSMMSCMRDGPGIVISAAGMLNGGRILHHLRARLPEPQNTVLFCGYQALGTKGRFLQDNVGNIETLRIHHQEIPIEAEVATIDTLSAHGDWQDFQEWLKQMSKPPFHVILNHGDPAAMTEMVKHVQEVLPRCQVTPMLVPGSIILF